MAQTMRIIYRKNCIKYTITSVILCIMVSLYIVVLKHNRNIHERFHFERLKVKRDVHSQTHIRQRPGNMNLVKEPPHGDVSHVVTNDAKEQLHVYIVDEHHEGT